MSSHLWLRSDDRNQSQIGIERPRGWVWRRRQITRSCFVGPLPGIHPYADSGPPMNMDVVLSLTVLAIIDLAALHVLSTLELVDMSQPRVLYCRIQICVQPLVTACRPVVAVVRRRAVRVVRKWRLSLQHLVAEGHCDALFTAFLCCFADALARISHLALEDILFVFLVGWCSVGWWWR